MAFECPPCRRATSPCPPSLCAWLPREAAERLVRADGGDQPLREVGGELGGGALGAADPRALLGDVRERAGVRVAHVDEQVAQPLLRAEEVVRPEGGDRLAVDDRAEQVQQELSEELRADHTRVNTVVEVAALAGRRTDEALRRGQRREQR